MNPIKELDKRILGEVYSRSETMDNLIVLCDDYNSRWPGSGDDRDACEYMKGKLVEYGLDNVHLEKVVLPGWNRGASRLTVTSPVDTDIHCIALPHSAEYTVEAELVYLGDGPVDVYEERKDEISGNVVMVTSRNPPGFNRFLHRNEKFQRSILAGAAGWIFMNHYPTYGPPTGGISPIVPSLGVSYEEGLYLTRLIERKGTVKVRIETECQNPEVESWNVVAELLSTDRGNEHVIYGAHYDGHDIAVGALDDATGAVCVMEVARALAGERENLKRGIRFVLFAAEEIGLYGSRSYVADHLSEMSDVRFMLNFDGAGRAGRQGFGLHGWPELEPFFKDVVKAVGVYIPISQGVSPYSDHWPFLLQGIPTSGMGDPEEARRRGGRGYGHTIHDTVDKADHRAQRECVANSALAAVRILNSDDWPVIHRSKEDINRLVSERSFTDTLDLGAKLKEYLQGRLDSLLPEARAYLGRLTASWEESI